MSDLFGNHVVGFPTRRLNCVLKNIVIMFMLSVYLFSVHSINDLKANILDFQPAGCKATGEAIGLKFRM